MEATKFSVVGHSVPRLDARDKARGTATFLDDMQFPGLLFGKVLRSLYAHARILNIDVSRARKLRGVRVVITGEDMPFLHGESLIDEPYLARGKVRYRGEAVAAVAAGDEETAEEALDLIRVEYDELTPVFDPIEAAKPGAPLIHEDVNTYARIPIANPVPGTNICSHFRLRMGDVKRGFQESDYIFEDTFTTQMQQHCALEPHIAVCLVTPDGKLSLWANNDSPYRCRREIANSLKLSLHQVRVVCAPYVGGNFGSKGGLKAEAPAIALAWNLRGKPIKVAYSREEEFTSSTVRHPSVTEIKTGVKRDGTILARQVTTYWDTGAYAEKGPTISRVSSMSAYGPYKIPNVSLDGYTVYTNKQVSGACRGYGGPQTAWAYESQMDIIAERLGLDPVEFRLKNSFEDGYCHASGQVLTEVSLQDCLRKVAEGFEWGKPTVPYRGKGVAFAGRPIKTPTASAAFVKLNEDGSLEVLSSTTEVGQGSETILCQIAAEEMGIPIEHVAKATPDTAVTPFDESTTASRSTFHMGNAVRIAAQDAKQQLLRLAARILESPCEELGIREGKVCSKMRPQVGVPISQVLRGHYGSGATILGRGFYYPEGVAAPGDYFSLFSVFWTYSAQGAEVEVDPQTGMVKVIKMVAAHDVGRAINPANCCSQIEGAIAMGLGYALYEELLHKDGNTLNPSLLSYKIPCALDIPPMEPILVEMTDENGPFGAKAVGEPALVPTAPAIANAIANAIGVRIKDLPITPDKVLAALEEKQKGKESAEAKSAPCGGDAL